MRIKKDEGGGLKLPQGSKNILRVHVADDHGDAAVGYATKWAFAKGHLTIESTDATFLTSLKDEGAGIGESLAEILAMDIGPYEVSCLVTDHQGKNQTAKFRGTVIAAEVQEEPTEAVPDDIPMVDPADVIEIPADETLNEPPPVPDEPEPTVIVDQALLETEQPTAAEPLEEEVLADAEPLPDPDPTAPSMTTADKNEPPDAPEPIPTEAIAEEEPELTAEQEDAISAEVSRRLIRERPFVPFFPGLTAEEEKRNAEVGSSIHRKLKEVREFVPLVPGQAEAASPDPTIQADMAWLTGADTAPHEPAPPAVPEAPTEEVVLPKEMRAKKWPAFVFIAASLLIMVGLTVLMATTMQSTGDVLAGRVFKVPTAAAVPTIADQTATPNVGPRNLVCDRIMGVSPDGKTVTFGCSPKR